MSSPPPTSSSSASSPSPSSVSAARATAASPVAADSRLGSKAVILGAGMVGTVMAMDLVGHSTKTGHKLDGIFAEVTIVDSRSSALEETKKRTQGRVRTAQADLSKADEIRRVIADADVVLGALSSVIGFRALETVIDSGKNYCDICFMPEEALTLDKKAKERGATCIVDCGVAPGMSNMFVGYVAGCKLKALESVAIYVGGLPRRRCWPFEYKAGFSPYDVIEEYTRPSRIVVDGKIVAREALSEPELIDFDFDGVGTLEAFNTDGLRSLIRTIKAPNMVEKTLRFPGHAELMRILRHLGLFSHEPIAVGAGAAAQQVRPIDVTTALLFPKWQYHPGEEDQTVMRIIVKGINTQGERRRCTLDLFDQFDRQTQCTSMARTTAFPNTIMARLVATGRFNHPGVTAPETAGSTPGIFETVIEELRQRGIIYRITEEYEAH